MPRSPPQSRRSQILALADELSQRVERVPEQGEDSPAPTIPEFALLERGEIRITPLAEHHDLRAFESGDPGANEYLKSRALRESKHSLATTYVVEETKSKTVKAYATWTLSTLDVESAGRAVSYPVIAIVMVAVDQTGLQQGLGRSLLLLAIENAAELGVRGVTVKETPSQRMYFEQFGFQQVAARDGGILFFDLMGARASRGAATGFHPHSGLPKTPEAPRKLRRTLHFVCYFLMGLIGSLVGISILERGSE